MASKLMEHFQTVEYCLSLGKQAELKIGPKLYSEQEREKLIELLSKYPNSFNLIILEERPMHQMIQIGNDSFELIVPNEICQKDIKSIGLSHAKKSIADKLRSNYESYTGSPASIDDIRAMGLYSC